MPDPIPKGEIEGGTLTGRAFEPNGSAVRLGNPLDHREPQSRAAAALGGICLPEAIPDQRLLIGRDPDPVIRDTSLDLISIAAQREGEASPVRPYRTAFSVRLTSIRSSMVSSPCRVKSGWISAVTRICFFAASSSVCSATACARPLRSTVSVIRRRCALSARVRVSS